MTVKSWKVLVDCDSDLSVVIAVINKIIVKVFIFFIGIVLTMSHWICSVNDTKIIESLQI
jgi:hypothetical protein